MDKKIQPQIKPKEKNVKTGKSKKVPAVILGAALVLIAALLILKGWGSGDSKTVDSSERDLVIPKSEITNTVKFYPVKSGKTQMEILAVRASDGTVRTAFNTCQVCNGSPRAYYMQQGDEVICQNCGNRFSIDMIEEQRGGCNPIPIMKEDKTDDGDNIIISQAFIDRNKGLFPDNWKKR